MFLPKRIIFQKDSLEYEIGKNVFNTFKDNRNIEIINLTSNRLKQHIPGEDVPTQYREGKRTLVVGLKKSLKFQSCKLSKTRGRYGCLDLSPVIYLKRVIKYDAASKRSKASIYYVILRRIDI